MMLFCLFSFAGTHTCDSSSDDIDADRARTATEEASYDQRREVWRRCGRNEPDLFEQNELVEWRRGTDLRFSHLQGTGCKHQSSQAYGPCSRSRVRRATGRLPRLHSMRPSPSRAMGSYLVRCRTLLPSGRCQSRRHQQANQSRSSYRDVSGPKSFLWCFASNLLT